MLACVLNRSCSCFCILNCIFRNFFSEKVVLNLLCVGQTLTGEGRKLFFSEVIKLCLHHVTGQLTMLKSKVKNVFVWSRTIDQ